MNSCLQETSSSEMRGRGTLNLRRGFIWLWGWHCTNLHWCVIRVFTESSSNLTGIAFRTGTGWSLVIDFIQAAVAVASFAFNVNLTCEWDFKQRYFEIQNLTCECGSNIDCEDKLSQVDIQCDYNDCIDSVQSPRQTKVLQTHKKSIFGVANVAVLGILDIK